MLIASNDGINFGKLIIIGFLAHVKDVGNPFLTIDVPSERLLIFPRHSFLIPTNRGSGSRLTSSKMSLF